MLRSSLLVLVALATAVGCSSTNGTGGSGAGNGSGGSGQGGAGPSGPGPSTGTANGGGGGTTTATTATTATGGHVTMLSGEIDQDKTLSGNVQLTSTVTVNAGVALTLSPGTTVQGAQGASLTVKGTLSAIGTAGAPIVFLSIADNGAGGWVGIVVGGGGDVKLTHGEIREASDAFVAQASSTYELSYVQIDTSTHVMTLQSNGTVDHGFLHALGTQASGDQLNIESASPTFTDTLVDNGNTGLDLVVTSGASASPTFDHVEVTGSHCAFHFNEGVNIQITNSYVHGVVYGLMNEAAINTKINGSNFEQNSHNVGSCSSGDVTLTGDYLQGAAFDGSCTGQKNKTPAGAEISGVGPRP